MLLGGLLRQGSGMITGFVVGSLLGHWFEDRPREVEEADSEMRAYRRRQGQFVYHAMTLCAKIAKADAPINRQEVNFAERLMRQHFRLNDQGRRDAIKIWVQAKDSQDTFDQALRGFYEAFGREQYQVNNMMDLLFAMVACDGGMNRREEEALHRAAGVFRMSRLHYERIKSRYYQQQTKAPERYTTMDPYYAILGANNHEPLDSIKKKYRALAMKWHPDAVAARGASSEAQRHAKEKFQQINEAYERIVEGRKV
jgi:DnaJ like chaperone protein